MYLKAKRINKSKKDLSNYVDGFDLYNSRIIDILKDYDEEKISYEIKTMEKRPDLIAEDIYGSTDYLGILYLTVGLPLESYTKGTVLKVFPKRILDKIIESL